MSERAPECVSRWPECEVGEYDPRCCRWPKSCSCWTGENSEAPVIEVRQKLAGVLADVLDRHVGWQMHRDQMAVDLEAAALAWFAEEDRC